MAAIRLLVGLGNPGASYGDTRHNVGRDFIGEAAAQAKKKFERNRQAEYIRLPVFFGETISGDLYAARFTTYMNESGPPLRGLLESLQATIAEMLVIVDDFMIPFGTLRLRPRGSSGGHNGLKSIIETFGTEEFPRLRVGVGPVPAGQDPADFVLEPFPKTESEKMPALITSVKDSVLVLLRNDFSKAMNVINRPHF